MEHESELRAYRRRGLLAIAGVASSSWIPSLAEVVETRAEAGGEHRKSRAIRVGKGGDVATVAEAARLARDGDTIEIAPGDYRADVAVWSQRVLNIRGVGTRPRLIADGRSAEAKAIFVIRGDRVRIENLAFFGARVQDRNGAGIRLEKGSLELANCHFEDNENGILVSNGPDLELRVRNSAFLNNGAGDGYSHHLYAGAIAVLEVKGSYFGPARKGHLLKSRARETTILYSRLTGEGGSSSYEIDIPNGGKFVALGNLVQQGEETENSTMISYGAEGYSWPLNEARISFNTLVNDRTRGGVFIAIRPGNVDAAVANNLLVGRGDLDLKAKARLDGNQSAKLEEFADPKSFDYRLRVRSPLVGAVGLSGAIGSDDTRPKSEYRHVAGLNELGGVTPLTPLSPGAFQTLAQ